MSWDFAPMLFFGEQLVDVSTHWNWIHSQIGNESLLTLKGVRQAQPLRLKTVFTVGAGLASPFTANDNSFPIQAVIPSKTLTAVACNLCEARAS